jgi:hypothetical protein
MILRICEFNFFGKKLQRNKYFWVQHGQAVFALQEQPACCGGS